MTNPIPRLTGAIHVYGGDFFGVPRNEWDPATLLEQPYDVEQMMRRFEEANALRSTPRFFEWGASGSVGARVLTPV